MQLGIKFMVYLIYLLAYELLHYSAHHVTRQVNNVSIHVAHGERYELWAANE